MARVAGGEEFDLDGERAGDVARGLGLGEGV
jgi:hypothetical protein